MGDRAYGVDQHRIEALAQEIVEVQQQGLEIALVIGAGNIVRGMEAAAAGMDRATADYAGMLATVLNSLTVQDALERRGAQTRVLSAITVAEVAEPYIRRRAIRHLEKGRIVIFAAGTGNPFFTTDTAAALRSLEIGAEAILMAKNGVRGVYDGDPREDPDAEFLPELTHLQAIERGLKVMDTTALSLCMDNDLPIHVFELADGNIAADRRAGERVGTLISSPTAGDARPENQGEPPDDGRPDPGRRPPHGQVRRDDAARVQQHPHRPRLGRPARPRPGRLLRDADAAEPARDDQRAGAADADHPAVRPELAEVDREGDHGVRPRPHAVERRQAHPPARSRS